MGGRAISTGSPPGGSPEPQPHFWTVNRRRIAFYLILAALFVFINAGGPAWLLTVLQFKPETVELWQRTLQEDTLSIVVLLIVAVYLDLIVRRDEQDRIEKHDRELRTSIQAQISDFLTELPTHFPGGNVGTDPRVAVEGALERSLQTHPEGYSKLATGIIGTDPELVIDDASLYFALSCPDNESLLKVTYTFKGKLRGSKYRRAIVSGEFNAEAHLLSGVLSDVWLIVDPDAFSQTLHAVAQDYVELRYRDDHMVWLSDRRDLTLQSSAPPQLSHVVDSKLYEADLSYPTEATSDCETTIVTHTVLPASPPGFRWFFDNPIYVKEIVFDVNHLWPGSEMDFTLYPFFVGTTDITSRGGPRKSQYRIGVNNWLTCGHGVMLVWERLGPRPTT